MNIEYQDIDVYSYDYYGQPMPQSWLRRHAGRLILALGVIASMLATAVIVIGSGDMKLAFVFMIACASCLFFLFLSRKDILAPVGIATLWYIFGFLFCVPFYIVSEQLSYKAPSSSALTQTVGLSLIAWWAFVIGSFSGLQIFFRPVIRWITQIKTPLRPPGHGQFILIIIWIAVGSVIRLTFNIGHSRDFSAIETVHVSGVIQYLFNEGSLIITFLFLYRALERSKAFLIEGYILFFVYILTQLLLGWKSAIIPPFVMFVTILWYQIGKERRRSLTWAFVMVLLVPITMQIGYAFRTLGDTGTAEKFSEGTGDFVIKTATRLDGNQRFAKVLDYETKEGKLSFTNGFKIFSLMRQGMPVVRYADFYVHKISLDRHTSTGCTGPGGAYIGMGFLGIILGYFVLGTVYRCVYKLIEYFPYPDFAVVLYGFMIYTFFEFIGSFYITRHLKQLFIISLILTVSRYFLRSKYDTSVYDNC